LRLKVNVGDSLNAANRREGIGGSARSLVLDGRDCTIGHPINADGQWFKGLLDSIGRYLGFNLGKEHAFEFLLSVGGKLVDAHPVGLVGVGVVRLNGLHILFEDAHTIGEFLSGEIQHESVVISPLLEQLGGGLMLGLGSEKEECSDGE
jgi:hypothetical protein